MSDTIKPEDILFHNEIVLRSANETQNKRLILVTKFIVTGIGLNVKNSFKVTNATDKIVYVGDNLMLAIRAYNKLYNK